MKPLKEKIIIGRREYVNFPELGIYKIIAKIDTGAYTTALHCHDIEVKKINEIPTLCFKLLDPSHPEYTQQQHQFNVFQIKEIKNSFGSFETRFIIKTKIKLGKKTIKSSISLTDRGNMRYPVLLGRKLLKNRFIVDVAAINMCDKTNTSLH